MTIWQSISTNFKNGNIAKYTKQLGQTFLQAGMTSAMFDQMTNKSCGCQGSIFSGGCYNAFGMYSGGILGCQGNNWFNPTNPYVNPMMIGMPNYQNQMNAMNVQYGNQLAWNWGFAHGMKDRLETQQQQQLLQNTKNEYAGDIDKNQSTELGKAFDKAASKMTDKKGNAVEGKKFEILKGGVQGTEKADGDKYRTAVSELGKSYLANMDKISGNGDGKVTLEEFTKHQMAELGENATDEQKANAKQRAQFAFSKIDQNGDGYADWKELAATFATYDQDSEGKMDGIITSEEYSKINTDIRQKAGIEFNKGLRTNYQTLFGKKTE